MKPPASRYSRQWRSGNPSAESVSVSQPILPSPKPVIYVGGTFDMFHWGHVRLLRNIKKHFRDQNKSALPLQSCHLIVAINSNRFCESYKRKPVMTGEERLEVIKACKYVDEAFIMDSWKKQKSFIRHVHKPNYIVMGSDWAEKDYLAQLGITQEILDSIKCEMLFMPYTEDISTSEIIGRVLNLNVL